MEMLSETGSLQIAGICTEKEMASALQADIEQDDYCVLQDLSNQWASTCALRTGGAVLVRPDGHVSWRSCNPPDSDLGDLFAQLQHFLQTGCFR